MVAGAQDACKICGNFTRGRLRVLFLTGLPWALFLLCLDSAWCRNRWDVWSFTAQAALQMFARGALGATSPVCH